MKCSKCGAECKETQKFCLNCGNPLTGPEPLDIQETLASSVGSMLDGFDDDDDDFDDFRVELDESIFDEEAKKLQKGLQVENIYSEQSRNLDEEEQWEYDEDKLFDDMLQKSSEREQEEEFYYEREKIEKNTARASQKTQKSEAKKKKKKKKIVITCAVVVIILMIAIGGGMYLFDNMHFNLTSFDDYYKIASREYKRKDYKIALSDATSALKKAQRAYDKAESETKKESAIKDMVKVRKLVNDIYEKTDSIDDDYAENLSELVKLDTSLSDYFVKLARYYSENKPPKVLTDFLRTVEDDNKEVINALADYMVAVPVADKQTGTYSQQFAVTLTCEEGLSIWYTINGEDPSTHGVQYTEPIKITNFRTPEDTNVENGITVLKAITINENKIESKVEEFQYEIVLSSAEPIVTPDSGVYYDYTEIKVEVPEGAKCYYTIGEGSVKPADPTVDSELYIANEEQFLEVNGTDTEEKYEPLQIPRGTHIMKFVIIDEYGIASDIAVRSYNLEVPRNVSLNEAEDKVMEMLRTENIIDMDGKVLNGNDTANETTVPANPTLPTNQTPFHKIKAEWDETILIKNQEYYIIYAIETDENDVEIARTMYLVDSYDKEKDVIKDAKYENGEYILPDEDAQTESETSVEE